MREHEIDDHGPEAAEPPAEAVNPALCPECQGTGQLGSGEVCPVCEGSGKALNYRPGGG